MEGDFAKHPGIGMEHRGDGTICMTQNGPIKKIIATAKMKECNSNKTPAPTAVPGSDAKSKPWDQNHWDCASERFPRSGPHADTFLRFSNAMEVQN